MLRPWLERCPAKARSDVRIISGAPPSTHLRTPSLTALGGQNGLFEQVLASLNPDLPIVELDDINDRPYVRLPEGYRPRAQVLTHHAAKALDCRRIDVYQGRELLFGTLQRSLRPIMVGFERVQPISEHVVQVCSPSSTSR